MPRLHAVGLVAAVALSMLGLCGGQVRAQTFPAGRITLIVAFAPGGNIAAGLVARAAPQAEALFDAEVGKWGKMVKALDLVVE
jgi:tripartite-type tricarboxylate transporter receptor subunit TctC